MLTFSYKSRNPKKNCGQIRHPLHKNIARITKNCRKNTISVVKCVKLLFPKEEEKKGPLVAFFVEMLREFSYYCKKKYLLNTFGNSNLTHLTTDVTFSWQHFAILAMFSNCMENAIKEVQICW